MAGQRHLRPAPSSGTGRRRRFSSRLSSGAGRDRLAGHRRSTRRRARRISLSGKTTHGGQRKAIRHSGSSWNQRCCRRNRRRCQWRHDRGNRWRCQWRHDRGNRRRSQWRHNRRNRGRSQRARQSHWNTGHLRDRRACDRPRWDFARRRLEAFVPTSLRDAGAQCQGDAAQSGTDGSHSDAESINDSHQAPTPSFTLQRSIDSMGQQDVWPPIRAAWQRRRQFISTNYKGGRRRDRPFPNGDVRCGLTSVRVGNLLQKR